MPGLLSGFAAPLRLVTIDEPVVDRPGWARLRTRLSGICGSDLGALSGPDQPLLLGAGVAAVRAGPRGGRRAARRLRGPAGRHPGRHRPGAAPARPAASSRARPARPGTPTAAPDHRRPHPARPADRLLRGHRRRLGRAAGRAPQPAARGAGGLVRRAGACSSSRCLRGAHRPAGRRPVQRPGAGERRRLGRPARHAGAPPAHRRRRDHRGRQARPPARAGAGARRHRGGGAGGGAAPASAAATRRLPAEARVRPRRTCSAASTSRSTRSAASSRWRPRCTRPGPAAGWCSPGCRRPPTCRAAWFRELEVVGTYASSQREADGSGGAFDIATELAGRRRRRGWPRPWPATRCTAGARRSTTPTRPAGSVP